MDQGIETRRLVSSEALQVLGWKYGGKESRANLNVVNQISYIGDEFNVGLASDIWEGELNVDYEEMDDAYGYYVTVKYTTPNKALANKVQQAPRKKHGGTKDEGLWPLN